MSGLNSDKRENNLWRRLKMVKRQLDESEKKMCNRNIKAKKERMAYLNYQIKYYDLMLGEGLEQNYLKTKKEFEQTRRDFMEELKIEENIVTEIEKQLEEGVEIKEITPVDEKKEETKEPMGYVG